MESAEVELRERIVRLETKEEAAKVALDLARQTVSTAYVISVITIIIASVALAVQFIKH